MILGCKEGVNHSGKGGGGRGTYIDLEFAVSSNIFVILQSLLILLTRMFGAGLVRLIAKEFTEFSTTLFMHPRRSLDSRPEMGRRSEELYSVFALQC